ncbi:unnamed protein product [Rotaria socialis]|uniref:Uncharacterized protein n=1 Tax=Rotaria socialis TaxID=392032 RepID=A0A817WJP3_9BILA|nr:unnamed protein product [Rotaria socialis]
MFIPGSTPTNTNLSTTTAMNNNLHHQQYLFDSLKDHRSNKLSSSSSMSRKTSSTPNFSLDPDLLRELNARYLHDISSTRTTNTTNSPIESNGFPTFLLPPFLRAEHYHQHTHTHEHNLNILAPANNASLNGNLNNSMLDKLSKSDNSLSPFLRTTTVNNFSPATLLPPHPPVFPSFTSANNSTATVNHNHNNNNSNNSNNHNNNINNSTKETSSSPSKKSAKWCAAHVRISWMIYHQQQRSKDKSSPSDNKKDDEQHQHQHQQPSLNNKLPDLISNTKPLFLPTPTSDLSLPIASTYSTSHLLPPSFSYRSPFDFTGVNNGPLGRLPPSSSSAFGGLGSLFPPPPPTSASSSIIDRKSDINGSVAAAAALGLDWSRFHRGIGSSSLISPLMPLSSTNDNLSLKKLDETNNSNHENRKRSSSVLNNDDDRRNSHHHLMLPPSHLTNNNYSSSSSAAANRSRSRSPHPSLHHHSSSSSSSSSSLLNKNSTNSSSSSPPSSSSSSHLSSSSRKRNSPNMKSNLSDNSKNSSHPPLPLPSSLPPAGLPPMSLPPTFGSFDPLTLSIIERQRLSAAYASLFAVAPQPNNYFPGNIDPTTFRNNGSSNIFSNVDSSAMTAALMQREHFLNSLRQQQEQTIERERAAVASINKVSKSLTSNGLKTEQTSPKTNSEETSGISPKLGTSPGSQSTISSSSESSKKLKHVKREKESPSLIVPSATTANTETILKEESNVELTPSFSTTA